MDEQDREVCVCFHVSLSKLAKFHRLHRPSRVSEMHRCYNAGTGCGWCIPHLERIFEQLERGETPAMELDAEEYVRRREAYRRECKPKIPEAPAKDPVEALNLEQVLEEIPDALKLEDSDPD